MIYFFCILGRQKNQKKEIQKENDGIQIEDNSINKYCKCSELFCNCCRDFAVPVLNINGPGKIIYKLLRNN